VNLNTLTGRSKIFVNVGNVPEEWERKRNRIAMDIKGRQSEVFGVIQKGYVEKLGKFEQGSAGRPRMRKDFGYVGTKVEICAGLRREAQDHARIFSMLLNFQKFDKGCARSPRMEHPKKAMLKISGKFCKGPMVI